MIYFFQELKQPYDKFTCEILKRYIFLKMASISTGILTRIARACLPFSSFVFSNIAYFKSFDRVFLIIHFYVIENIFYIIKNMFNDRIRLINLLLFPCRIRIFRLYILVIIYSYYYTSSNLFVPQVRYVPF